MSKDIYAVSIFGIFLSMLEIEYIFCFAYRMFGANHTSLNQDQR